MPPFDFGRTISRSINQVGQQLTESRNAILDRRQRARARRALNRYRMLRLANRVRNQRLDRRQAAREALAERRAEQRQRRQTTVEVPRSMVPGAQGEGTLRVDPETAAELRSRQTRPRETIEVQRENIPSLPGSGPANVDPDTLIRHGHGDRADGKGGQGQSQTGSTDASGGMTFPDSLDGTKSKINELVKREQKLLEQGAGNEELAPIQERLTQLKRHRDVLLRRQEMGQDSMAVPRDTTTAPPDTSRSGGPQLREVPTRDTTDTPQPDTSGVQRRIPEGATGWIGGGGASEPSHAVTALDPRLAGATDYDQVADSTLVERALRVAWERSPTEAQRRLDGLVEQGQMSPATRDTVVQRMERKRQEMLRRVRKARRRSSSEQLRQ